MRKNIENNIWVFTSYSAIKQSYADMRDEMHSSLKNGEIVAEIADKFIQLFEKYLEFLKEIWDGLIGIFTGGKENNPSIQEQSEAIENIIKAAKAAGAEKVNITIHKEAEAGLQAKAEELGIAKINLGVERNNTIQMEVVFKKDNCA